MTLLLKSVGSKKMRVAFAFFSGLLLVAPLNAADRPENLVPLMRFYDTKFNEHIYSYSTEEMNKWHQLTHVKEHEIIGDVATSKLPGTVPLWRAVRTENKQSRHYYYLEAVQLPPNTFVDAESFKVYVWTKPGDGRVPIYCTTWIDATDAFMHRELKVVEQNREETEKSITFDTRKGMNADIADYDNDGYLDLIGHKGKNPLCGPFGRCGSRCCGHRTGVWWGNSTFRGRGSRTL